MKKCMLLLMCILTLALLFACEREEEKTIIQEIPNTMLRSGKEFRYFVISNPPEDFTELLELCEKFMQEFVSNDVEHLNYDVEVNYYHWFFFRETRTVNVNYKEDHGYFSVDRIENHMDDLIVSLGWSKGSDQAHYHLIKRASSWKDYGKIIKEEEIYRPCEWAKDYK